MSTVYPLSAIRTLALYAQGLTASEIDQPVPGLDALQSQVEVLGCIQIEPLQVVQRSHYLVLWSRFGEY
jgi:uncharacterized protein YcaQ